MSSCAPATGANTASGWPARSATRSAQGGEFDLALHAAAVIARSGPKARAWRRARRATRGDDGDSISATRIRLRRPAAFCAARSMQARRAALEPFFPPPPDRSLRRECRRPGPGRASRRNQHGPRPPQERLSPAAIVRDPGIELGDPRSGSITFCIGRLSKGAWEEAGYLWRAIYGPWCDSRKPGLGPCFDLDRAYSPHCCEPRAMLPSRIASPSALPMSPIGCASVSWRAIRVSPASRCASPEELERRIGEADVLAVSGLLARRTAWSLLPSCASSSRSARASTSSIHTPRSPRHPPGQRPGCQRACGRRARHGAHPGTDPALG